MPLRVLLRISINRFFLKKETNAKKYIGRSEPDEIRLGSRSRRLSRPGEQILSRSGRRRRRQHHEGHLHQELQRRHQGHHSVDAISQQGKQTQRVVSE